jgi:quercetin dioxygenase-like cupin family protein
MAEILRGFALKGKICAMSDSARKSEAKLRRDLAEAADGRGGGQTTPGAAVIVVCVALAATASAAGRQAVAGAENAKPVQGDPGISSMVVIEEAQFRVLRDYAEPGATRRMHAHKDATYHVFTLITGQLRLTIEGQPPIDVTPGQALSLKGGVQHTFTNTGKVTATIVEVFGKQPKP